MEKKQISIIIGLIMVFFLIPQGNVQAMDRSISNTYQTRAQNNKFSSNYVQILSDGGVEGVPDGETVLSCQEALGEATEYIDWGIKLIQIAAPILLLIFGALDFGKAVISNDQDALKKAGSNFVKRAIATIAIFFVPMLIELLISTSGLGAKIPNILCGI